MWKRKAKESVSLSNFIVPQVGQRENSLENSCHYQDIRQWATYQNILLLPEKADFPQKWPSQKMYVVWWQERQQTREEGCINSFALNKLLHWRAECLCTHSFCIIPEFSDWWFKQCLKSSTLLHAGLEEALKLTSFCSALQDGLQSFYGYSEQFLIIRSLFVPFLVTSGCIVFEICIERQIAAFFLGLFLISFPFGKRQWQDFLHKKCSTDV